MAQTPWQFCSNRNAGVDGFAGLQGHSWPRHFRRPTAFLDSHVRALKSPVYINGDAQSAPIKTSPSCSVPTAAMNWSPAPAARRMVLAGRALRAAGWFGLARVSPTRQEFARTGGRLGAGSDITDRWDGDSLPGFLPPTSLGIAPDAKP